MNKKAIAPMSIRIPSILKSRLEEYAESLETTQVQVIIEALREFLDSK